MKGKVVMFVNRKPVKVFIPHGGFATPREVGTNIPDRSGRIRVEPYDGIGNKHYGNYIWEALTVEHGQKAVSSLYLLDRENPDFPNMECISDSISGNVTWDMVTKTITFIAYKYHGKWEGKSE